MITLDDICFAYDDTPILSHLNGTIGKGQTVVLTGPNGSGKSTPFERPRLPPRGNVYLRRHGHHAGEDAGPQVFEVVPPAPGLYLAES